MFRTIASAPGRFADWTTDPGTPTWKAGTALASILIAATALVFGLLFGILAATHTTVSCPRGETFGVIGYSAVTTTVTPQGGIVIVPPAPVYGCTA